MLSCNAFNDYKLLSIQDTPRLVVQNTLFLCCISFFHFLYLIFWKSTIPIYLFFTLGNNFKSQILQPLLNKDSVVISEYK